MPLHLRVSDCNVETADYERVNIRLKIGYSADLGVSPKLELMGKGSELAALVGVGAVRGQSLRL